jgi:hypothetical protein
MNTDPHKYIHGYIVEIKNRPTLLDWHKPKASRAAAVALLNHTSEAHTLNRTMAEEAHELLSPIYLLESFLRYAERVCVLGESPEKNTYFFSRIEEDLPAKGTLKRGVGVEVTKRNI